MPSPVAPGIATPSAPGLPASPMLPGIQWKTTLETENAIVADVWNLQLGNVAFDTSQAKSGTRSAKVTQTGTAAASIRGGVCFRGAENIWVVRFWFRPDSITPAAQQQICTPTLMGTQIAERPGIRMSTAGVLQAGFVGGTFQNGPTALLNTWQSVDMRINVAGPTHTLDWMVNGVAQTQATRNSQPDLITEVRIMTAGANTISVWFDDFQVSTDPGAYPLGDIGGAPTNATMTFTATATASAILANQPGKVLVPGVATASAIFVKQPGKVLVPTAATMSAILAKLVARTFAPTSATASATLAKTPGHVFTPSVASASATIQRQQGRTMTTSSATATAILIKSVLRTFSPLATASAVLLKTPGKVFAATATASAILVVAKVRVLLLTTSVTTASATLTKQAGHTLATSAATASATLTKSVARTFTPSMATASAILRRTPGRILSTSPATATATLLRQAGHIFRPSASAIASLIAQGISGTLAWPPISTRFRAVSSSSGLSRLASLIHGRVDAIGSTGATGATTSSSGRTDGTGNSGRTG